MARWYYKGTSTANYNDPERGPRILTPRTKFEAPVAAVQHLIQAGLIKRLPDLKKKPVPALPVASESAPVQTSAPQDVAKSMVSKSEPEPDPKEVSEDPSSASWETAVVESSAVVVEEEAGAEESSKEKESGLSSQGGRRKRRRGLSSGSDSDT
jgi:hypothetical protein